MFEHNSLVEHGKYILNKLVWYDGNNITLKCLVIMRKRSCHNNPPQTFGSYLPLISLVGLLQVFIGR